MSSCGSLSSATFHAPNDSEAHWFHHLPNSTENLNLSLREQKVEFEEKLVNVRQEIVKLHQEILGLKELLLKVVEDHGKIRPILDDRKRNALLRRHQPFPFVPDHTRNANSQENGNDISRNSSTPKI